MADNTVIPAVYVEFCEEVARLARKANLRSLGMTFSPGFGSDWRDQIQLHWEDGRHGDASRRFIVTSTVTVRAEIKEPK